RNVERPFQCAKYIIIAPAWLRRRRYIPVCRTIRIDIDRTEAANANRIYLLIGEVVDHLPQRLLRSRRRKADPVFDLTVLVADAADELPSTCFNCTNAHISCLSFGDTQTAYVDNFVSHCIFFAYGCSTVASCP